MDRIVISGGRPLHGSVEVSGMKNAALPIILGCLLTEDKCVIENIPDIDDVKLCLEILRQMGGIVRKIDKTTYEIDTSDCKCGTSPRELVKKMRASYYLLGAELGRYGRTSVATPGGCDFGNRPIDQHQKGFEALGAPVNVFNGYMTGEAADGKLHGSNIFFDFVTVGGTMNIMLAAVKAEGMTVIENAAREPHIVDLANFLNTCGAKISGAGTDTIKIKGVQRLRGCSYAIIPDMIEAGTYMLAAAATKGSLTITNVIPKHLESISAKLQEMGVEVIDGDDYVTVNYTGKLRKINVKALPYPGFPTDMQPQMCCLMCLAEGSSILTDGVYDSRFRYVNELRGMGADISVDGRTAYVNGVGNLMPANVKAVDLRAGAAVIIAGLAANGVTEIEDIYHIERGYDNIVGKLRTCGAIITKITDIDGVEVKNVD